jgi:rhodanese-related sulfurtransferase
MKNITAAELKGKIDKKEPVQIIDVREEYELDICSLGGKHIPLEQILESADQIRRDIPVVVHCRAGSRAAAAILSLENNYQFDNLLNLEGGIIAWAESVDPKMEKY